jgi:nitrite reductase/ring-hydroxylating ferredoxin subunit
MTDHRLAIGVCQGPGSRYSLLTFYDEADPINAVAQLVETADGGDGAPTRCVLNTAHPVDTLWRSPSGALWLGSADGHVFTTAPTGWQPAPSADFDDAGSGLNWRVSRLPLLQTLLHNPVITSLAGRGDQDVFVGTSNGSIYRWQGNEWRETTTGLDDEIVRFAVKPDGVVFALGGSASLFVLEGEVWRRVVVPGTRSAILTGGAFASDGSLIVCSNKGAVFRVADGAARQIAQANGSFYNIVMLGDRAILAGDPIGAWQLTPDGTLAPLRETFGAVNLIEAAGKLHFVLSEQDDGPGFAVYEPATDRWYIWVVA